jgi:polyisoprenoid-binding protein YceI
MTACTLATVYVATGAAQDVAVARSPVTVSSATVTIEGTSTKDPFVASTKTVRVTRLRVAGPRSGDVLQQVLQPGGLEAFDATIPVVSLTSPDEGVAGHIHESLEADTHPEIRFQLRSITPAPHDVSGFVRLSAGGTLTVAGVERDVTLTLNVMRAGDWLLVDGNTDLLMTDFGVKPPKGLLGMLRTDPLIRVRVYVVVRAADPEE